MLNRKRDFVVAGIGTDVGKTVVSAILCEALGSDYWKPVASGSDDVVLDDGVVRELITQGRGTVHPCTYTFKKSLSPHIAAKFEDVEISLDAFVPPHTENSLLIELAGGLAVPLNDRETNLDLIERLQLPVVVVSRHYLGSINHTLLSIEALQHRGVGVLGIICVGDELPDTERIIATLSKVPILGTIPLLAEVSRQSIRIASSGWDAVMDHAFQQLGGKG
jgi:dethiobiotin synthetase